MSETEFVGHQIDDTGIRFHEDKLIKVTNFPQPTTMKHLRSFLGLANYFRDHVRNHSIIAQPLQHMVDGYKKNHRFHKSSWTPETAQSIEELKEAIHNCQKLYFLDDCNRVILETDASDYGIGAYLRQEIDGKDYSIMFISESFTSAQLRWSVPKNEGYAIVYIKIEHLLRDRQFDLYTDHENLTRLYSTGSQKVMRWRMYMQEYNFTIHYKKGRRIR